MKLTRKMTEERILNEQKVKAKKLRLNPEYEKDLIALEKIEKALSEVSEKNDEVFNKLSIHPTAAFFETNNKLSQEEEKLRKEYDHRSHSFFQKYDIQYPYSLNDLHEVENGRGIFYTDCRKAVDIHWLNDGIPKVKGNDVFDSDGYIYIKINPQAQRDIIHHLIGQILDRYSGKYDTRFRQEQSRALQVWEERKTRKPFKQIANELGIKEPAAKKAFYKAYELIYGKKYDPAGYEKPEIKKEYLRKTCNTCMEKSTCKDLCPDVITFVEQGVSYQRERILPNRKPRPKEDQDSI